MKKAGEEEGEEKRREERTEVGQMIIILVRLPH